ncbi:hypothetical protein ACKGJI_00775 [Sulfurospirillum sp. 1307]
MDTSKSILVKLLLAFLFAVGLNASVYEQNCVSCHEKLPVKIDKFFYRYLLKYSSEENLKNSLKDYLKNPSKEKSILQEELIDRFGIKKPTTLDEKELQEAIDEYWEIYKVFGKLK